MVDRKDRSHGGPISLLSLYRTHRVIVTERERVIASAKTRRSPLTEAKIANYMHSQNVDQLDAAFNGRPHNLCPSPIAVYEPAFASFYKKLRQPFSSFNFSSEEIAKARSFIEISLDSYHSERDRLLDIADLNLFDGKTLWVGVQGQVDVTTNLFDDPMDGVEDARFPQVIFTSNGVDPSILGGLVYIQQVSSDDVSAAHFCQNSRF